MWRISGELYANNLLERILHRDNMNAAYNRVKSNKGSHGVEGMKVDELLPYLKLHDKTLIASILEGTYRPMPVRRVEIEKPNGGIRLLGIPTVVDRMVQQPVTKAKEYMEQGCKWVVDIDLSKYFDTVNHDKLMALVATEIKDKRVLKLIRLFLQSGVLIGVMVETEEGWPQGGPLSPLLSNIMLTELDREFEKRGHKFCRYADDNNIFVKARKREKGLCLALQIFLKQTQSK
jgi:retron-type reverse transcriptase